jgi:predicted amidohydrolase
MRSITALVLSVLLLWVTNPLAAAEDIPEGWIPTAQREEIRPAFTYVSGGGPNDSGAYVITMDDGIGQQGWFEKKFPVTGGQHYRFQVDRKTEGVEVPRRCAIVRITWQDQKGQTVKSYPFERELEGRPVPSAEPEHPLDGLVNASGWSSIDATYCAPEDATHALIELHLQWAPNGKVFWANPRFKETAPLPSRKIRLAAVHYKPKGKSPRQNCEEFAPLLEQASQQKADLVVLGETVPTAGVAGQPHELAESIPGPSTDYFCGLAKQHALHLVFSLYERDGRVVYNTAILIDPTGKIVGKYRKVCLPHGEVAQGIMPGHEYPVFETKLGKIGLMICYDGFFPEVARELTNRGAEVIAWPVWGCDPLLAKARANENRVYIVSSTFMDAKSKWMLSAVYDREGSPLVAAEKWGTVVVSEVDLNNRRVGPYNLGDFHDMVQRHRPPLRAEDKSAGLAPSAK